MGSRNVKGAPITPAAGKLKASGRRSSREVGNPSTNTNLDLHPNPHSSGSYQGENTVKVLGGRSSLREDASGGSKKNSREKVRNRCGSHQGSYKFHCLPYANLPHDP